MSHSPPDAAWEFCDRILVDVSRSFALIIPRCPPPIDRCLCVGYLLCRLADTIEDDEQLAPSQRDALYDALLACVDHTGDSEACSQFVSNWPREPDGSYGELVRGTMFVLRAFASLPPAHQAPLIDCVHEMIAGMRSMRPLRTHGGIEFYCLTPQDLDRYCHYVAGTVGVMSTRLFERHLRDNPKPGDDFTATDAWREQGRRMGLGLQMTNIIKDASIDAGRGVSFVPPSCVEWVTGRPRLSGAGRAELIRRAIGHLDEAIAYTTALPGGEHGIRTFLLGSILPAIATLEIAAAGSGEVSKIDRTAMRALIEYIDSHPDNASIRAAYAARREACLRFST